MFSDAINSNNLKEAKFLIENGANVQKGPFWNQDPLVEASEGDIVKNS